MRVSLRRTLHWLVGACTVALLHGCASRPPAAPAGKSPPLPVPGVPRVDDPTPRTPAELMQVPDAVPRDEPIPRGGPNRPYELGGERHVPLPPGERYEARGIASWYGRPFHGRKTANGETFNMYAMTAAHKTLPLPSFARVTNPANGRSVVVRVNDRGPFTPGRLIDLSYTAAVKLGIAGIAPVQVQRILPQDIRDMPLNGDDVPEPPRAQPLADPPPAKAAVAAPGFWLQLGAYREAPGAMSLQQQAAEAVPALSLLLTVVGQGGLHRVQAGPFATREEADAASAQVRSKLLLVPVVVQRR
jgi:rare lipoprotein A